MLGLLLTFEAGCQRDASLAALPARPAGDLSPALATALDRAESAVTSAATSTAWTQLGQLYHANGYYREAQYCYAEIEPPDARTHYLRADLARQLGDPTAELEHLTAATNLAPDYVPGWLWLAEVRYKAGDVSSALAAFQEVLQREPAQPQARLGLAREYLRSGARAQAAAELDALLAQHPTFSSALALQARLAEQAGDSARAAQLREASRGRKDPPPADPWLEALLPLCHDVQRLGIVFEDYLKAGLPEPALAAFHQMEAIAPDHWLVHRFRATIAAQQGRAAEAVQAYEAALAAHGELDALYPPLVDELIRQERFDEAERRAREGLQRLPRNAALHGDLAELLWRRHDAVAAEAALRAALALAPQDVPAHRLLSWILWQSGRRAEARPHLETLRRLVPDEVAARAMLGELLLESGQFDSALAPLEEAHALAPNQADVQERLSLTWLRLGNQRARDGQLEAALTAYAAAIRVRPTSLEAHTNRARVLLAAGRPTEALAGISALAEADPTHPQVYLIIGDIARAAGRTDVAQTNWRLARSHLPADADPALRRAIEQRLTAPGQP